MAEGWHLARINAGRLAAPRGYARVAAFLASPGEAGVPIDRVPDPWCVGRA